MGWFVDLFVAYFFKGAARWVRLRKSREWPMVEAIVTASSCPPRVLGCSVAEVAYRYAFGGDIYTGLHEKPFISRDSAQEYLRQFTAGTNLVARIKPGKP